MQSTAPQRYKVRSRNDLARRLRTLLLLVAPCLPAVPQSTAPPASLQRYTADHKAMGTVYTLTLYTASAAEAESIEQQVFDEIDRLDALLSNYQPSSELSRLNRLAGTQTLTTDDETMRFLEASRHWSSVSDGAFDITVGRLMKLWGFYQHQGRIPAAAELSAARTDTGWDNLQLDPTARTVRFTAPGVELDPGGIGKGFAVDAAVALLREDHVHAAMISAGGSTLYAIGAPPGEPGWKIVIPGPLPLADTLSTVWLRDTSLSSADCSQKHFVVDGHLYCHILDPRTLRPVEGRVQVTIVDPSATASDALSNVLFVLAPEQSFAVLAKHAPQASALVVSSDGTTTHCALYHWNDPVASTHCTLNRP